MIASHAMLLDFVAHADNGLVDVIVPDASIDSSIFANFANDFGGNTPQRRIRRKRHALDRQVEASIRTGKTSWLLAKFQRIERDMQSQLKRATR